MPVIKFPRLTILLLIYKRKPFRIFDQFKGLFKEPNKKLRILRWERKRENTLSSSMGTKKRDQRERESYSKFLISKSWNVNSNKFDQLQLFVQISYFVPIQIMYMRFHWNCISLSNEFGAKEFCSSVKKKFELKIVFLHLLL